MILEVRLMVKIRRERLLIGRDMRGISKVLEFFLSDLGVKVKSKVSKTMDVKRKKLGRVRQNGIASTKGKWVIVPN